MASRGGGATDRGKNEGRGDWAGIVGDDAPFDPAPWLGFDEVILFGANHFFPRLPEGGLMVWIKQHPHLFGTFLGDAEVAWRKGSAGVFCFYKPFKSPTIAIREACGEKGHPTQKSIDVMAWLIRSTKAGVIADPYMGSGTTGVAAVREGRGFVGCEIVPRYFETARRRIAAELAQPRLEINAPAPREVQPDLI